MEGEYKKPGLREVLQALLDGKEVRLDPRTDTCWRDLEFFQNTPGSVIYTSAFYEIRDKVRPHHHAKIIKVWVENPAAYQTQFLSRPTTDRDQQWMDIGNPDPAWREDVSYRLVDAKTGEPVMESGAKP